MDIGEIGFRKATYQALKRANINDVEELLNCTKEDLLKIKHLGFGRTKEIEIILAKYGYPLKD